MRQQTKTLLVGLLIGIGALISARPAAAQLQPSGEVLLPYFEVDLQKASGVNTTFAVANALDVAVNVEATVFTNWGIALSKTNLTLAAREVRNFDLRSWIAGDAPGQRMNAGELSHFKAALSGQRSPKDKLYYGSQVRADLAVGYVRIKTLGNPRPRALWGDYFILNDDQSSGEGDTLINIDPSAGCQGLCKRHALRFLTNDAFDGGTQVVIWSETAGKPSSTATPPGTVQADAQAFDEAGRSLGGSRLRLLPVQIVSVADLGWDHQAGWIDLVTETTSAVAVHFNSQQRFGIALMSYCLTFIPGPKPGLEIEKLTNGEEADLPPGPSIAAGQTVVWDYVVYNSGGVRLTDIRVTDNKEGAVSCPKTSLEPGERMTCTQRGTAQACQYANLGTVRAKGPDGKELVAEDPSHYFGDQKAAIDIEKLTNGEDADTPTGPIVEIGAKINWTYVVTNTGQVALSAVKVVDDQGVAVSCPLTSLRPGEKMTCTASGTAIEGQYKNLGTVTAQTSCGAVVRDEDPSHYFGQSPPGLELKKLTNGQDYSAAPGSSLALGGPVRWDYVVTNTGKVKVNDIKVSDDVEGPIACPKSSLNPGESMTCSKTGVVKACQYANKGTVTAVSSGGKSITKSDVSWYFGNTRPGLKIETLVNGQDADTSGPTLSVGSVVDWTYVVTNTGDVALRDVKVSDDKGAAVSCPKSTLAVGEAMTCSARGTAVEGTFKNTGSASGTADTSCGGPASASDPATYYGRNEPPGIEIKKTTNGNRCGQAPGNKIKVGGQVRWDYLVTNIGKVRLDNIQVQDDVEGAVACPKTSLNPGESMTCSKSGYAKACQYTNKGTVTAYSSGGKAVTDDDLSFYFGESRAELAIETLVNGKEADSSPGVEVPVGSTVDWTYVVKNTGDVALRDVKVSDDKGAAVSCPKSTLAVGEAMTCSARGTAVEGTFKNTGSASGTADTSCGGHASAYDPAYYYGRSEPPGVEIKKTTNGNRCDQAPGNKIKVGGQVRWDYLVTNIGKVRLDNIQVQDDVEGAVACPKTALNPGESMTCSKSGYAKACQYTNKGTVTAYSSGGKAVTDDDLSFYFGESRPELDIETLVNDKEADSSPGAEIKVGDPVTWKYVVKNTGDVALRDVKVSDDQASVSCPKSTLAPGETMTCTASGKAEEGIHKNTGKVTGTADTSCGGYASDYDSAYYYGRKDYGKQGCTPGYWKNHESSWSPTGYPTSQKIKYVFSSADRYSGLAWDSLIEALHFQGGSDTEGAAEILLRAGVAALLNASHSGVDYPRSASSVISEVNSALASKDRNWMLTLASSLDRDNNLGCPLN